MFRIIQLRMQAGHSAQGERNIVLLLTLEQRLAGDRSSPHLRFDHLL